ncbi:hypothetical protein [Candidatus Poriferisodalis sp.]|uniref:hypothetical protein n=1 Tax=Candidatus Poriferisodalis sp. TaxID=3101277 RepID=UPI003AF9D924
MMRTDPTVDGVEAELDEILTERLTEADLPSIQKQPVAGEMAMMDLAWIIELVSTVRKSLIQAVTQANREAQEREATAAPQGAPETQPGLSMPDIGAEQPEGGQLPGPMPPMREVLAGLGRRQAR